MDKEDAYILKPIHSHSVYRRTTPYVDLVLLLYLTWPIEGKISKKYETIEFDGCKPAEDRTCLKIVRRSHWPAVCWTQPFSITSESLLVGLPSGPVREQTGLLSNRNIHSVFMRITSVRT